MGACAGEYSKTANQLSSQNWVKEVGLNAVFGAGSFRGV